MTRSASGARSRWFFSGFPGVTRTQSASRSRRRRVSSTTRRWPSWMGLKLPPNRPMRMPDPEGGSSVMPGMRMGWRRVMVRYRDSMGVSPSPLAGEGALDQFLPGSSRSRLTGTADAVFEAGELLDADRAARMLLAGGNADLAAKAELATIGELGRGIVQQDGAVDLVEEFFDSRRILGNDRLGVVAGVFFDMGDGLVQAVDDFDRDDGGFVFGAPVCLGCGTGRWNGRHDDRVAADFAALGDQRVDDRLEVAAHDILVHEQGFGGPANTGAAHLGVQRDGDGLVQVG